MTCFGVLRGPLCHDASLNALLLPCRLPSRKRLAHWHRLQNHIDFIQAFSLVQARTGSRPCDLVLITRASMCATRLGACSHCLSVVAQFSVSHPYSLSLTLHACSLQSHDSHKLSAWRPRNRNGQYSGHGNESEDPSGPSYKLRTLSKWNEHVVTLELFSVSSPRLVVLPRDWFAIGELVRLFRNRYK